MGTDTNGDWDGICACGKAAMDGVKCHLGATHQGRQLMPWEISSTLAVAAVPSSTSQLLSRPLFPWSGTTETEVL